MPDVPHWLQPLAARAHEVSAEQLSPSFPTPPDGATPAAVLMVFAEDDDAGPVVVLTQRSSAMRTHAGHIALPGGSVDASDASTLAAALREAEEEVGLSPEEVEIFGELPPIWLPPNNFAVTTVLGYWPHTRELCPEDPSEVASVFAMPIAVLLDPANRYTLIHPSGHRGPAFDVGASMPLWGFTAGLVARLFKYAGWERPWDRTDVRSLDTAVEDT